MTDSHWEVYEFARATLTNKGPSSQGYGFSVLYNGVYGKESERVGVYLFIANSFCCIAKTTGTL